MSYTTIKAIWPGEKVESIKELRNSHGSAPVIWDEIAQKYLGLGPLQYSFESEKLWPLWKDMRLPRAHRAALTMTYDRVYVEKRDYKQAAADIRQFLTDCPHPPEYVNHWPEIADLFDSEPDYPAIGFQQTSVAEELWRGPYNEETDEFDQIEWSRTYSVYREIEESEAVANQEEVK